MTNTMNTDRKITPEMLREGAEKWRGNKLDGSAAADVLDAAAAEIERLEREVSVRDLALRAMAEKHCSPDSDELAYTAETHESYIDYFVVQPAIARPAPRSPQRRPPMPNETLTERLVRGMNLTGTWVPLTQAQADALEFPDPTTRQVYQLPDWWEGDDISDVAAEVCVLERALELACSHANFGGENPEDCPLTLGWGCPRGYDALCFDPSQDECFAESYVAQARAELEVQDDD